MWLVIVAFVLTVWSCRAARAAATPEGRLDVYRRYGRPDTFTNPDPGCGAEECALYRATGDDRCRCRCVEKFPTFRRDKMRCVDAIPGEFPRVNKEFLSISTKFEI